MTDTSTTPDPNDQMIDPAFGEDEMEAWLASLGDQQVELPALMSTPLNAQGQEGEDEPNADDEPAPDDDEEEQPPPEENADFVTVNGQQFAKADIQRLWEFDQYMRANPDAAQRIAQAIPEPATPPVPTQATPEASQVEEWTDPTPPEGFDLEDPQIKVMWDMQVVAQRTAWNTQQEVKKLNQAFIQDKKAAIDRQAAIDMDTALTNFRTQFPGLNDDDIKAIRTDAGPFVTGMMKTLPPVDALFRSMEVAAYANTDLRQKLAQETPAPTQHQTSTRRKKRLGSIAGTPRSAPKVEPRPSFVSDRDMINAVAHELSDQMANRS